MLYFAAGHESYNDTASSLRVLLSVNNNKGTVTTVRTVYRTSLNATSRTTTVLTGTHNSIFAAQKCSRIRYKQRAQSLERNHSSKYSLCPPLNARETSIHSTWLSQSAAICYAASAGFTGEPHNSAARASA